MYKYIINKFNLSVFICFFLILPFGIQAQQGFSVLVQSSAITAVPPVHSGAIAEWNGKWFFLGGRIDGLHIMQGNQAFPAYGRNDSIYMTDPALNTRISVDATQLPSAIYEALSSANMEFSQDSSRLYMIGGYGKQATQNNWITFPSLIAIDLPCLEAAMSSGSAISSCFRQLVDTNLAVAGGMLEKMDSTYYLVFGHRFDGRYVLDNSLNVYQQTYTHEVRKFTIDDDGVNLGISNYRTVRDTDNFHRRDFNLVPQIFPSGEYGFTAFGGVFQKNADLPFLTPIDISSDTVIHRSGFNQNLNQYTSAVMPLYDAGSKTMHTLFFGGMSLYTLDTASGSLVQDTLVPFVNTISRVSRDSTGLLSEYKMNQDMPGLLGSNAFFIPSAQVTKLQGNIIDLDALSGLTHVGYIVGGIESDLPNVGMLDPESMSRPHATVLDVYIDKTINSVHDFVVRNALNDFRLFPNPVKDEFHLSFTLPEKKICTITLYNSLGKEVGRLVNKESLNGVQHFSFKSTGLEKGLYYCKAEAGNSVRVIKVIVQ